MRKPHEFALRQTYRGAFQLTNQNGYDLLRELDLMLFCLEELLF